MERDPIALMAGVQTGQSVADRLHPTIEIVRGVADEDYKKYYPYFSNRRHFVAPMGLARIIGKPALFSLTNGWAKFYQVDEHRRPVAMEDEF